MLQRVLVPQRPPLDQLEEEGAFGSALDSAFATVSSTLGGWLTAGDA